MLALAAAGCRVTTPEPLPNVARESGVELLANPTSLVIRPGGSGRIRFQARDEAQRPLAYYPVDFTIVPDTPGARLSTLQSLTDPSGETVVEVIVGALPDNAGLVSFVVVATSPGAPPKPVDILVTTNAYAVEIFPVPADNLLGFVQLEATRLYFYDNLSCQDLDLYDISSSAARARPPYRVAANDSYVYRGVAASGVHAVVGLGLDGAQTVIIGGCVDIPGAALLEAETMRATLLLDRLFPALSGTFAVSSDFQLTPPPSALGTLRSAWQQWQRCSYDPARLWLDCALAALGPNPNSCIPSTGSVGTLAELVSTRRGAPLPGTPPSASETPCRDALDTAGNPGLEVAVDALFANARGQLAAAALGALPTELATLLDYVRLSSRLSIANAGDANTYWAEHRLLAVTFPDALARPIVLGVNQSIQPGQDAVLAVPIPAASKILATFKSGQLSLPNHGFTLHLGTAARHAFETASLGARNAKGTDAFVQSIFSLAQLTDQRSTLTGCAAFDAIVCDHVAYARGCIVDACQAGLVALERTLVGSLRQPGWRGPRLPALRLGARHRFGRRRTGGRARKHRGRGRAGGGPGPVVRHDRGPRRYARDVRLLAGHPRSGQSLTRQGPRTRPRANALPRWPDCGWGSRIAPRPRRGRIWRKD